jgi:hypothetical protein
MANYWQKRSFAELSTTPAELAKRGLVYLMAQFFDVAQGASTSFCMTTNGAEVEFQFFDIVCTQEQIKAELIEAPSSITKFGPAITARNLNRNFSDSHSVGLQSASGISGGTVVASELIGSDKASGANSSVKVHTLSASTEYAMVFFNTGNQDTTAHLNLGWTEADPDHYNLVTEGINDGGVT